MGIANSLLTLGTFVVTTPCLLAHGGQLSDGTVFFEESPRLVDVITTFSSVRVRGAKYYFTIELPNDVGESLGKVTIQQRQGTEDIKFYLEKTVIFEGTPNQRGEVIALEEITTKKSNNSISLVLSTPVSPGKTFTIGLFPKRNPEYDGVYLFGVTAFPPGDKSQGLYLGVGRLQFYQGTDGGQ